jgi:hypothetical protein
VSGPFSVKSPVTGLDVFSVDGSGNSIQSGYVLAGSGLILPVQAVAPAPGPGSIALWNHNGTLSLIGNDGTAISQEVTGNLTVDGTTTLKGAVTAQATVAVTGKTTLSEQLTINSADTAGAVMINQTVATSANPATFWVQETAANNSTFGTLVAGDAHGRFTLHASGEMDWGNGTLSQDTQLSRTAAGVLTITGLAVTNVLAANGGTSTAGSAPALTPTFANGVASQLTDTTRDYTVYLQIGTAGTAFTLAIGPTSGVANTLMASATPLADQLLTVRLPAGWFLKWAGTSTTLTTQTAIGC